MKRVLIFTLACMLIVPGFISCKKETKSADKYREAAEQGDAKAQNNLGVCYRYGLGVEQDDTQAAHWIRKSAEQGYEVAQLAVEVLGY
jgi:TPR repeat protein